MWHDTLTSLSFDRYVLAVSCLTLQTWALTVCQVSHDQHPLLSDSSFTEC